MSAVMVKSELRGANALQEWTGEPIHACCPATKLRIGVKVLHNESDSSKFEFSSDILAGRVSLDRGRGFGCLRGGPSYPVQFRESASRLTRLIRRQGIPDGVSAFQFLREREGESLTLKALGFPDLRGMKKKRNLGYSKRNAILKQMGFRSYSAYLNSGLWARIRAKKLAAHPKCYGCDKKAAQVHHGKYTYQNLSGLSDDGLYSVCGVCHFTSEFTHDDKKRSVRGARIALHKKRRNLKYFKWKTSEMDQEYRARLEREP